MNGKKTMIAGLLLAAVSISGDTMAQQTAGTQAEMRQDMGGTTAAAVGNAVGAGIQSNDRNAAQENPVSPEGPSGSTTTVIVGPAGATYIDRSISLKERQGPGNTTAYDPATGQTVFIPTISPPDLQLPRGDISGDTLSRSIPDLPPEIAQATLAELLDSPYLSNVDIDRDSIAPAILNGEVGDLLGTPGIVAMVNSMITKEQFDTVFDAINNNSGQIVSDMLDNVQMPTGTGS